ncbi:MAG: glycosyltransferase [Pseudomonadota bacterium]
MARIAAFAFDIAEAAQIRRIQSLRAIGHDVVSLSFRRANMNRELRPDWPDLPLGVTRNESYLRRLLDLARATLRGVRGRQILQGTDIWIARNFDLLVLAILLRRLTGRREVRLVYECLDIHGLFTRDDRVGRTMRWLERRALARVDLLIVSSPGFLREYFLPLQGFQGQSALIENKLWLGAGPDLRPKTARRADPDHPLRLGWVGSLRCAASLKILAGVAETLGQGIEIAFHGNVHRHAVPDFDAILARHQNMRHFGPYAYPDDLAGIYGACDLVWAQDLWQRGANSDWLLPNRIYEASYFGCPSIALKGTETGTRVATDGLGFVVDAATPEALITVLTRLSRDENSAVADGLLQRPETAFRLMPDDLNRALAPVTAPERLYDSNIAAMIRTQNS